ncbi:MAG: sigma-70 family RNA polymerase sigma factor [Bacteroidales bacterium]|nr:MAG: sigma-70 family RNA polymerase sigma factor [Bacteroidales bacterium]
MKKDNDELLMISVRRGILEALGVLFDKYHVKLFNFFLRLTFDRELSKDLTQNVFYRILKYRHTYREEHKFRSWMYQIARNSLTDHYDKAENRPKDQYPGEYLEDPAGSFEDEMENRERQRILYTALSRLSADQRELLELSRFQGLRYEEIAEITGNSVGAIRVKIFRIIQKLRKIYFQEV